MAELRMTADAETATPAAGAKRTVAAAEKKGLAIQDLILAAVLLAAGAVLKLTVGSLLASFGMKPNFIIAAYCLAIILIRPTIAQSLVIGLIAGLVCQIPMLNATPLLNIPSELLGALVCGLLIRVPMKIGKLDVNPLVNTFVSTCVSGFTFAALSAYINVVSVGGDFAVAMAAYAPEEGTEALNCWFGASCGAHLPCSNSIEVQGSPRAAESSLCTSMNCAREVRPTSRAYSTVVPPWESYKQERSS